MFAQRVQPASLLLGALLAAGALFASGRQEAEPEARFLPDDIEKGTKLYELELSRPTAEILPGATPLLPVEVKELRDPWVLVEVRGLRGGPVWLNFEHVLRYRTSR